MSSLKLETASSFEKVISTYTTAWCHNPEEHDTIKSTTVKTWEQRLSVSRKELCSVAPLLINLKVYKDMSSMTEEFEFNSQQGNRFSFSSKPQNRVRGPSCYWMSFSRGLYGHVLKMTA